MSLVDRVCQCLLLTGRANVPSINVCEMLVNDCVTLFTPVTIIGDIFVRGINKFHPNLALMTCEDKYSSQPFYITADYEPHPFKFVWIFFAN